MIKGARLRRGIIEVEPESEEVSNKANMYVGSKDSVVISIHCSGKRAVASSSLGLELGTWFRDAKGIGAGA